MKKIQFQNNNVKKKQKKKKNTDKNQHFPKGRGASPWLVQGARFAAKRRIAGGGRQDKKVTGKSKKTVTA